MRSNSRMRLAGTDLLKERLILDTRAASTEYLYHRIKANPVVTNDPIVLHVPTGVEHFMPGDKVKRPKPRLGRDPVWGDWRLVHENNPVASVCHAGIRVLRAWGSQ